MTDLTEQPRRPASRALAFQDPFPADADILERIAWAEAEQQAELEAREAAGEFDDDPDAEYEDVSDADVLADVFPFDQAAPPVYGAGYYTVRGPTGRAPGRPTRGTSDVERAREMVERHIGIPVAGLLPALGRGRKTVQQQVLRVRACDAVRELRQTGRARPGALAEALGVSVATIHRMAAGSNATKPS